MRPVLIIAAVALGSGIVIGKLLPQSAEAPAALAPASNAGIERTASATPAAAPGDEFVAAELDELRNLLRDEIRAREALAQRLDALGRQVASLQTGAAAPAATASDAGAGFADTSILGDGAGERQWFDEQALLDSGMDEVQARQLKMFFETIEMERLTLRDRAAREGWERGRLGDEMQGLRDREETLRQDLGEDGYDAYLYASGQSNRVEVSSVLESAQAGQAGIRSGDQIIRYDNERIYSWRDLRNATTSGDITDTVEVEVERDGETLQFYLARGPLGIRMNSLRVAP